jgi:hypothetical protein
VDCGVGIDCESSALSHSCTLSQGVVEQFMVIRHAAATGPTNTTSRTSRPAPLTVTGPRRVLIASLLAASTLGGGCVFFQTQAYDFAQDRWQLCQSRIPDARLEEIEPDGLIRFSHPDPAASSRMQECLNETADRQALRVLAPKPPPAIALPTPP